MLVRFPVALAAMLAGSALAQVAGSPGAPPTGLGMPSSNPTLTVSPLRGGAYWVSGGVSNSGFVIGDTGVIVIDAQTFLPAARTMLADVARLTPKPVNTVILTHSDPDHINGLPAFPRGVEVIAHENARRDIERVVADPRSNGLPPSPEIRDYVPGHVVRDTERLTRDGVRMVLIHTAPAHTDGDLIVYLPDRKLVYAGDLLTPEVGRYPGIHPLKHGSSLGWIQSVRAMLALDADLFVSGHGGPLTRGEVTERLRMAERRRAEIKALVDKHLTLAEVKATLHDQPNAGLAARFPSFIETTYQELTTS